MRMFWGTICRGAFFRLFVFVFALLLTLSTEVAAGWQPEVKVGLATGEKKLAVTVTEEALLKTAGKTLRLKAGQQLTIGRAQGKFSVAGKTFAADSLEILSPDEKRIIILNINGKVYRGNLLLLAKGDVFTVINRVPVEEYLRGVVSKEMPPAWPEDALKAQAVAARTFALKNRGRHQDEGYDLCPGTHCQVYEGMAAEFAATDKAIGQTYGEVLFGAGVLVDAPFHTDSGGMTENSEDVWGTYVPHLRAAEEDVMHTHPWEVSFTLEEFSQKLASRGIRLGKLKKIELSPLRLGHKAKDRSASGRVKEILIIGSAGQKKLTGSDMRNFFGLKSTLFDLKLTADRVIIEGYGWGHGLGLSQWGARAWAGKKNYQEILAHYYENTEIKKLY